MNRIFFRAVFIVAVIFFASSCKVSRTIQTQRIVQKLSATERKFEHFDGKAKIKYRERKNNLNLTASIRIKRDSVIWISLSPGLGIEAARVKITPTQVLGIDKINRNNYVLAYSEISRLVDFEVDFSILQSLLMGLPAFDLDQSDEASEKGNKFHVIKSNKNFIIENVFLKEPIHLRQLIITDKKSGKKLTIDYDEFEQMEGGEFPTKSSAVVENKGQEEVNKTRVEIKFKKANVVTQMPEMPFDMPTDFNTINKLD